MKIDSLCLQSHWWVHPHPCLCKRDLAKTLAINNTCQYICVGQHKHIDASMWHVCVSACVCLRVCMDTRSRCLDLSWWIHWCPSRYIISHHMKNKTSKMIRATLEKVILYSSERVKTHSTTVHCFSVSCLWVHLSLSLLHTHTHTNIYTNADNNV